MQGYRELHRPQVGAEVAAGARHAVEHIAAQLRGQRLELCARETAQVRRAVDSLQEGIGIRGHLLFF
ncbi:hypothetical protein D3C81_2220260 [compost metagenome]